MSIALGLNDWIAFGEEVTFGTPVTRTKFLEVDEESIQCKETIIAKPTLRNVSQHHKTRSKRDVGGPFKFQLGYEGAEKIIKHAMGTMAAVSGSGPYTHAATLASALPVGLTVECPRDDTAVTGDSAFLYDGCQISKLTLSQAVEDILMCEVELVGRDRTLVAATSATFPDFYPIDWSQLVTFTVAGVSVAVESWDLTIENALASDRYKLGDRKRKGIGRSAARKISGKFTCEYEQLTEHAYFIAQDTLVAMAIGYSNGLAAGNLKTLAIAMPKVAIQGDDPVPSDSGPIKITLAFEAFMSAAQNDEMTLTLVNAQSVSQA